MKLKLPPYVQAFTDRHGKARYYFRKAGSKSVALPGAPFSTEFMDALSVASDAGLVRAEVGSTKTRPGTINALFVSYFNSHDFKHLALGTRDTYRGIIENFRIEHGDRSVALLRRENITRLMDKKSGTPAAANNLLKILRIVMKFAVLHGFKKSDPTVGIRAFKMRSGGFYTWSEEDIAKFEAHHPIDSRAGLAHGLLLYTGQRRSDAVLMGRGHIKNGVLSIRQQKTGALVQMPVVPKLRAILDANKNQHMTFLVTSAGKPFTSAGFGNWFREMCNEAGLRKECAAHGLRKAAARRLAEAGCSAHEIMAVTGHKSLREVTRYTDQADREHLAQSGMAKMVAKEKSGK